MNITYSGCVSVAFVILYANRMRSIILSSLARLVLPYFSTLFSKRHDFRLKVMNIKCFHFFLRVLSETFLVLRVIRRDAIINVRTSSCKVPVIILVGF